MKAFFLRKDAYRRPAHYQRFCAEAVVFQCESVTLYTWKGLFTLEQLILTLKRKRKKKPIGKPGDVRLTRGERESKVDKEKREKGAQPEKEQATLEKKAWRTGKVQNKPAQLCSSLHAAHASGSVLLFRIKVWLSC